MSPYVYLRRKQADPHHFMEESRYVAGRLHSHARPVEPKRVSTKIDDPATRGLTIDYEQQIQRETV